MVAVTQKYPIQSSIRITTSSSLLLYELHLIGSLYSRLGLIYLVLGQKFSIEYWDPWLQLTDCYLSLALIANYTLRGIHQDVRPLETKKSLSKVGQFRALAFNRSLRDLRWSGLASLIIHSVLFWVIAILTEPIKPPELSEYLPFELVDPPQDPVIPETVQAAEPEPPPPVKKQVLPDELIDKKDKVDGFLASKPTPTPIPTPTPKAKLTPTPTPKKLLPTPRPRLTPVSNPELKSTPNSVLTPRPQLTPLINAYKSSDLSSSPPPAKTIPSNISSQVLSKTISSNSSPSPIPKLIPSPIPKPFPTEQPTPLATDPGTPDVLARPSAQNLPRPQYPERARHRNQEGTVILRARVNEQGQVLQVNVVNSSGYPDLDQAAQKAVQTWSFLPATKGGQPITSWVNVPISFSLR